MQFDISIVIAFAGVTSFIILIWLVLSGKKSRLDGRLESVRTRRPGEPANWSNTTLPKVANALAPEDEKSRAKLKDRMIQAGLYRQYSMGIFVGIKYLMMVTPMIMGGVMHWMGLMPAKEALTYGAVVGLLGTLTPSLFLGQLKKARQTKIRRSFPDALDVIVICLEGGLTLPASFDRVASELHTAHPMLADEMAILKREIQLGCSTGEALKKFANRFDVAELRSMSSVVTQAERFGASVTQALKVHAETLRLKRYQHAEAMAQKAPVKLIFPVATCILPALYIVMMAPAFRTVYDAFQKLG